MKSDIRKNLKKLVIARDEWQQMRKRIENRVGVKADGSQQNVADRSFSGELYAVLAESSAEARRQEKKIEKMLAKELKKVPIYTKWLSEQKGVGPVASGWILSCFDIELAETVSKMWQYAGMNPGLIFGKKRINRKKYKSAMGEVVAEVIYSKGGKERTDYIVRSNEAVRGDRPTEGFILPYNKRLKSYLLGVLADSFIKQKAFYRVEYYDNYKSRLENEQSPIVNPDEKRNRKDDGKLWKDVSKGHRHAAAKRYMIKMFLKDLYVQWRSIEGLPVRVPYAEEYLGKKHNNVVSLRQHAV